ncbi:Thioredoxin [Acaryochloris thomasi RCC1774]|uniref:Thioredoxin n=2 Tax=Acaryochloris TaxID=155977 RepID=A0A2W1JZQ3_9CYAN|nr:Thioredoxin [Acaryochloris thomasi RCC1774]
MTPPTGPEDVGDSRLRNLLIALSAAVLAVVLFFGVRGQTQSPSLTALATASVPLDTALANGQPTLLEFYADWCTSCQAMAADMAALKQQYQEVNFVMLNVDNTKWLPEISRFGVDGIPHFVFINRSGEALANAIGQQPRTIMAGDLTALAAGQALPEQQLSGQVSMFTAETQPRGSDDPRSHGGRPAGAL